MKTKRFVVGFGISLAVVMMLSIWGVETVTAQECKLIKITSAGGEVGKTTNVDPKQMTASSGDCIFWANVSKEQIKIRFYGNEECIINPVGFDCEGSKKSFVTGYFGIGGSKSLQIAKPGTYNYEIQTKNEPSAKTAGAIVIQ